MAQSLTLILGGIRSGKTALALSYAEKHGSAKRIYIATARESEDDDFQARIAKHKKERGEAWQTIEAPLALAKAIKGQEGGIILVDCLSLWVTNLLMEEKEEVEIEADFFTPFFAALETSKADIILVSQEVSLGGISANALQRKFCDLTGLLHQRCASVADTVWLAVAGLKIPLKG